MKAYPAMRALPMLGALFLVAACSTTIKTSQSVDSQMRSTLAVTEAAAKLAPGVAAPQDTPQNLQDAVMKAASEHSGGTTPVRLDMTVTLWSVRDAATRLLAGALAGSNKMDVAVDVIDVATNNVIGHYDVQRSSNPGGYGIFYDQAQATINEAAKGVIEGLYSQEK